MAVRGSWEHLSELDRRAAALARGAGVVRLMFGEALARIDSRRAHHSFGFSSLGAYVAERCQRSVTWARDVVRVARALELFPSLKAAVLEGTITWSALGWALRALRPYATAQAALAEGVLENLERLWLTRARSSTVRELAERVRQAKAAVGLGTSPKTESAGASRKTDTGSERGEGALHPFLVPLPKHVLTLTVSVDAAWWFECARRVYERSVSDCPWSARSTECFMLGLLAEARTALEGEAPLDEAAVKRWGAYLRLLGEWRQESERRCDAQREELPAISALEGFELLGPNLSDATASELDAVVRRLSLALGHRDLELGMLAEWLLKSEAWRRLGFASEAHYVRERMGYSYSQWKARRALARRLGERSLIRKAFIRGEIGLEAALLLLRVVRDEESERSWVERARERTYKHLREEVRLAELGEQQFGRAPMPPSESTMRRALALEGRVKSGAILLEGDETESEGADSRRKSEGTDAWRAPCDESRMSGAGDGAQSAGNGIGAVKRTVIARRAWLSLRSELAAALRDEAEPDVRRGLEEPWRCERQRAQVRLRLSLERDTLVEFRALEKLFRRQHVGDFFEFLCRHFLEEWAPAMLTDVKYAHIYRRDAFCCSSPVCSRNDVQPHHLRFRSRGGGEEDENLTALCTWCHLEGVHGGRIRVMPPASAMHWRIGSEQEIEVRGRRKNGPPPLWSA